MGTEEKWALPTFLLLGSKRRGEMKGEQIEEKVAEMVSSYLDAEGFELYDLTINRGKRRFRVQLTIDRPGGVTIDDCATVSRTISPLLDAEDPFYGSYDLEVSSPGINRKLLKLEHFERYMGERVKVKTRRGTLTGVIEGVDAGVVKIAPSEGDGVHARVPFDSIIRAQLDIDLAEVLKKKRS